MKSDSQIIGYQTNNTEQECKAGFSAKIWMKNKIFSKLSSSLKYIYIYTVPVSFMEMGFLFDVDITNAFNLANDQPLKLGTIKLQQSAVKKLTNTLL